MLTKPRLRQVKFYKEVEVDIVPERKVTCDGPFELDYDAHVAIFSNNVRITEGEMETFTDKLTVYLHPETNQIDRVVTEGNVKVVHRGDLEELEKIAF